MPNQVNKNFEAPSDEAIDETNETIYIICSSMWRVAICMVCNIMVHNQTL